MRRFFAPVVALGVVLAVVIVVASSAVAAGTSTPTSTNGNAVQLVATGLDSPTSFAFGDGSVFEGDSGNSTKLPNGGLYVLKDGKATELKTSLVFVGGLQFHGGKLYISGAALVGHAPAFEILAFSGWNGTAFASQKVIYTAPKSFQGFNGLGFGANGKLYVGVDAGLLNNNDHGPASTSPDLYDILSMSATGGGVKVFASGMRQPWQLAFPAGSSSPYVSDFGQDSGAKNPPDFLLRVKAGQDYGFPKCTWISAAACKGFAKPFATFAPHTDLGGLAFVGHTLYGSEFGFAAPLRPAAVVSLPLSGKGSPKTIVSFPKGDSVIGLGANGGYLYFGVTKGNTGTVYRVKV
jgi:glucose/arabinose dehydrogenase